MLLDELSKEEDVLEWLVANKSTGDEEDVIEDVTAKTLNTLIGNIDNLVVLFCSYLFASLLSALFVLISFHNTARDYRRSRWRGFYAGPKRVRKDRWWLRQARYSVCEDRRRKGGRRIWNRRFTRDRLFREADPECLRRWVGESTHIERNNNMQMVSK